MDSNGLVNQTSAGPVGATAACTMLKNPKIKPTAAPEIGPAINAAMMAGICKIVNAAPPNQGINPQCVHPSTMEMAAINAVITIEWVGLLGWELLFMINNILPILSINYEK
jgi:hypothetical protein